MIIHEYLIGTVTFRNGTQISLNDSSVISASVKRQACSGNQFSIGGVYAAQLTMKCAVSGTNSFRLRGAKIRLFSMYGSESGWTFIGTFWITDAKRIAGDIYQITALDAVSWLDSSSFNDTYIDEDDQRTKVYDSVAKYFESQGLGRTINGWCAALTGVVSSLLERMTGEQNALTWKAYNESVNGMYTNHYALGGYYQTCSRELTFWLSTEFGSGLTDCSRDLFRHLAALAGGFIFADTDGKLTLGQFSMPEYGKAEIQESEIQQDSCEIADYLLQTIVVCARSEIEDGLYNGASSTSITDFSSLTPFRIQADANPFLDGFAAVWCRGTESYHFDDLSPIVEGLYYFHHRFRYAGNKDDVIQTAELRPFSCIAHTEQRFHLGQKIGIHYQGSYYESEITAATWNFRGGWQLSCAGADSRAMADALRASRADKALTEARNRCMILEKKL